MNRLVEEIIKPILEANTKIKKVVGVYGGRFQPFGPHHYKTYKWLAKQVDDAYITTSNIKKPPRHPMNFKEKVRHMSKMGVPSSKIIEEKTPYVAKNLQKKFNSETTAFVYIFGQKDAGRLTGGTKKSGGKTYYQDFKKNKNNLEGYETHGYILTAPHVTINVGGKEVSGTAMRELLGSSKIDDSDRVKLFKKMFGYYDKGLFSMLTNKFKKLFELSNTTSASGGELHNQRWGRPDKSSPSKYKGHRRWAWNAVKDDEEELEEWYPSDEELDDFEKKLSKHMAKKYPSDGYTKGIAKLKEVDIPIKIGDTVMMGKFKNKKVVIKSIDWNEKGDLLINGRPAFKFRLVKKDVNEKMNLKTVLNKLQIPKTVIANNQKLISYIQRNPFIVTQLLRLATEDVNVVKKKGKDGGDYRDYNSSKNSEFEEPYKRLEESIILDFLVNRDVAKIIKETSITAGPGFDNSDDGPSFGYGNFRTFKNRNVKEAEKLGYEVLNYLLTAEHKDWKDYPEYPDGPVKSVSYAPAGVGTGKTPNNQIDLVGSKMWNAYKSHISKVATAVGMELIDFGYGISDDILKSGGEFGKDTLIQGDKETPKPESKKKDSSKGSGSDKSRQIKESFSKEWWLENLFKEIDEVTSNIGSYAADEGEPDTGHLDGGRVRKLGTNSGKPEPWFDNLGFKQLQFPKADYVRGKKDTADYVVKKIYQPTNEPIVPGNEPTEGLDLLQEKIVTKTQLKPRGKELLLMGGAYGHMAHPFDDKDLTFGDLKKIITDGLGGQLNREDGVTEKLDGQNIMVSWKDGKLIAARNKGHIKNGGKTALDAKGIKLKFAGRGNIANAFNFAMKDLGKSIGALSDKQRTKIFNNGYNFMNLEVMWPKSANVIDYDVAHLVFHGALKYDDNGKVIGEVPGSARMLAGMIKQVNMHIGKKYSISKPVFLTIPKHQDFSAKKDKFLGKLSKLKHRYGLKDNDTLALYHQKWWEVFISNKWSKKLSGKVVEGLVKRWAFFDKSYSIPMIKADMQKTDFFDEKALQEILDFDKKNHAAQVKENMKPFETLFFEVGAEILKNVQGFMAANPDKAVQGIRKRLDAAIKNVRKGGDLKKLNTLKLQLDKLNAIGGTKAIVPSEGIVFKYKGKTYKFTGAFAPVNQITGLISF